MTHSKCEWRIRVGPATCLFAPENEEEERTGTVTSIMCMRTGYCSWHSHDWSKQEFDYVPTCIVP
jgi:hypothetical protein